MMTQPYKNILTNIILLTCVLLMNACRQRAVTDVAIPKVEVQLVMYSFLSPEDSMIEVHVTKSVPVFGTTTINSDLTVSNADVKISNGVLTVQIPFDPSLKVYRLSQKLLPVIASGSYIVTAKSGSLYAKGSTTVPANIVYLAGAKAQEIQGSSPDETDVLFNVNWKDEPGIKNYYRVNLQTIGFFGPQDTFTNSIADEMLNDDNKDGNVLNGQYQSPQYKFGSTQTSDYFIYLLNTDVHYYRYHLRRFAYSGDDPLSEPFQQYSNVEGGLGLVGSFRKSVTKLTY